MKKILFSLCFIFFISGCVMIAKPPNNVPFKSLASLNELNGLYQNVGVTSNSKYVKLMAANGPHFLSRIIWPSYKKPLKHESIEKISVTVTEEGNSLEVKALTEDNKIIKADIFISGKDFEFKDGILSIGPGWDTWVGPRDNPVIGPKYDRIKLGLDTKGNGKSSYTNGGFGLIYMMFPIAGIAHEQVRFIKIK